VGKVTGARPRARETGATRPGGGARLGALDLGTNNCRLLVAAPQGDGFRVVDSFSRIVRLGEGLAATNRLSDTAMQRTLAALRVCAQVMERHRVSHARCVATEACRRAANGPEFMERARRATGIELELLDQEDEARLAMLGCLPLVEPEADQVVMVDIGGGSTEVMWLDRWAAPADRIGHAVSLPLGVVTLSESLGHNGGTAGYAAMVDHVHERLLAAGAALPASRRVAGRRLQMIGTSGTVTTLAAVHLGLHRYDRRKVDGVRLGFPAVDTVAATLRALSNAERAAHPCIGAGRADLVVAGYAILDAVHRLWPVEELRVADRGLREGILAELMGHSLSEALLPPVSLPADAAE
jgi:exopolyphosphatase / guanosine-5'-triphosphate,3'-diphosphate pyrophosphatase